MTPLSLPDMHTRPSLLMCAEWYGDVVRVMFFKTLRFCGESNCNFGPVVMHMYVEVGVVEVEGVRVVVFEEIYVTGTELEDGSRTGLANDCQYFWSFVSADTSVGSFTGANGCTSAAMATIFERLCYVKRRRAMNDHILDFENFLMENLQGSAPPEVLHEVDR